jgi:hypothetical protein
MVEVNLDKIPKNIKDIERDLGLPIGFLVTLKEEDDWSFIIKLHALFEAAYSHLLSQTLATILETYSISV